MREALQTHGGVTLELMDSSLLRLGLNHGAADASGQTVAVASPMLLVR